MKELYLLTDWSEHSTLVGFEAFDVVRKRKVRLRIFDLE